MNHLLLIAAGGAAGAVSRHWVNQAALRLLGPEIPSGTIAVNVIGGFLVGLLVGWLAQAGRPDATELRFALGVGFLGAFTTMSAFSLDIVLMLERRDAIGALLYAGGTVGASVIAVFAGLLAARQLVSG